jgi:CheY-like chemotaxis protein
VRCLIVDDSADFVEAARSVLERGGMTVVGVASTSADALRSYEELRPEVTLIDIDLGGTAASWSPSNFIRSHRRRRYP